MSVAFSSASPADSRRRGRTSGPPVRRSRSRPHRLCLVDVSWRQWRQATSGREDATARWSCALLPACITCSVQWHCESCAWQWCAQLSSAPPRAPPQAGSADSASGRSASVGPCLPECLPFPHELCGVCGYGLAWCRARLSRAHRRSSRIGRDRRRATTGTREDDDDDTDRGLEDSTTCALRDA